MIVGSRRKQRGALRTHDSAGEAPPARACAAQCLGRERGSGSAQRGARAATERAPSRALPTSVMHVKAAVSGIMTRAQGCVRDGNPTD